MNHCLITYQPCGDKKYSENGLKLLSPRLKELKDFPYTKNEQLKEAIARATKISIQGVQPKLSVKLNIKLGMFEIVDKDGTFIIKPQNDLYPELPENEDLTMHLAACIGIEVPVHGLVYCKDGTRSYFIKRFDRAPKKRKVAIEDFAQLTGKTRDTKYNSSMEKIATVLEEYCTFPLIEKRKLFVITIFNFLVGNEDMHLKNFSLIRRSGKVELSPSYDLLNTTIAMPNPEEEMALPLAGKKSNFKRNDLVEFFGMERMKLTKLTIDQSLNEIKNQHKKWIELIESSFLTEPMKENYLKLLEKRWNRIFN